MLFGMPNKRLLFSGPVLEEKGNVRAWYFASLRPPGNFHNAAVSGDGKRRVIIENLWAAFSHIIEVIDKHRSSERCARPNPNHPY